MHVIQCVVFLAVLGVQTAGSGTSPFDGQDTRIKLAVGELFVPRGFQPKDNHIDLIVHFHGSGKAIESCLSQRNRHAVLVTVTLNGLSSVYARQFARPAAFLELLDEASDRVARELNVPDVSVARVTVSSFSAGFGGVRELLKSEECYRRIDALVMADSIYAGYAGDGKARRVDPALMAGFVRFARDAAAGRKRMVISHCELQPEGYASTRETADYLLHELSLTRMPVKEVWAENWICSSRCEKDRLHVFGFEGDSGADHMRHLHNLDRLIGIVLEGDLER